MSSCFFPLTIGTGLLLTFAGTMRGAASADIGPRQAVSDNLGELNAKNGNQNLIANNLGIALGSGLFAAVSGTLGGAALPLIGALSCAFGVYATSRMLKELDMNPVNEKAVRDIVDALQEQKPVPGPSKDRIWSALKDILTPDKIELGQDPELLRRDQGRFAELKSKYADRQYLLEAVNGEPYVVLKQSSTANDRFQAMVQAVTMQRLAKSPEYKNQLDTKGQDEADFWLVEQSLAKTPEDIAPLVGRLKDAGWSVDMFRFKDTGQRVESSQL